MIISEISSRGMCAPTYLSELRGAEAFPISSQELVSFANVPKSVPIGTENGPRRDLRGPFPLVAGTGFEPATSGL